MFSYVTSLFLKTMTKFSHKIILLMSFNDLIKGLFLNKFPLKKSETGILVPGDVTIQ